MRPLFFFTLCFFLFPSCVKNNAKEIKAEINFIEQLIKVDDDQGGSQHEPELRGSPLEPQPKPKVVELKVRGSPLEPQPKPKVVELKVRGSPLDEVFLQASETASSFDDRLLAAQVLVCGIDGKGRLPAHMKEILREVPAGAVILFRYNLDSGNDEIRALTSETVSLIQNEAGIAPFISVDHEGGTVNRFRRGVAHLPDASSYLNYAEANGTESALEKIENESFSAAVELVNLGINMNFAPVAEYLNSYNSEFLKSRSYGPDPEFVSQAARAFVRGMERAGVLCASKHFPTSAGADPHFFQAVINAGADELNALVSPFAGLIAGGARAVMVSHCLIPSMDNEISSLSPVIMRDWLRGSLGFNGIIVCDDFTMEAARKPAGSGKSTILSVEEAVIKSLAAGSDLVLVWPPDIRRVHRAILAALAEGRLPRERLREASGRIIHEKLKMGLKGNF